MPEWYRNGKPIPKPYTWWLWLEEDFTGDRKLQIWNKEDKHVRKVSSRCFPDDDPTNPYHAQTVAEEWVEDNYGISDFEHNDYLIVYVEDQNGNRFKVEITAIIDIEYDTEGWAVEQEPDPPSKEEKKQKRLSFGEFCVAEKKLLDEERGPDWDIKELEDAEW